MGQLTDAIAKAIRASDEAQAAIARRAGVDKGQISRLLSGERGMNSETIEALAAALDLKISITPNKPTKKSKGGKR